MSYRHFKYEGWLYALAFVAALAMRFIQLGAMPLSDAEAESALQALAVAQGAKPALGAHPLYILSTSLLFFAYGGAGANFLARFFPALVGSLLVFVPLLFVDERIKPRTGVLLACFIALDPGLVALSRQAASPILAVTFTLLALGFFSKDRIRLTGVASALALLSGPSVWLGILGLGITWAISQIFERRDPRQFILHPSSFILAFLSTFIVAGSLFFIAPNGLSAALASIPAFFSRWTVASEFTPLRLMFSLGIYQPFAILLALIATVRGWWVGSKRIIPLSIWFWVALLLAIFLPAREIGDLAWALIPLLALASIELTRKVDVYPEERKEGLGAMLLTVFIWTFMWLDFSGMAATPLGDQSRYVMRLWLLGGAAILLALSLLLVAAGWSARVAQTGGIWGLALGLGLLGLGGAFGSAGLRGLVYPELWHPANLPAQAQLLEATVSDMSEWGVGNDYSAPVMIVGIDSPALEWTLREHQVTVAEVLDVSSSPAFVVTQGQNNPALASAYRGQDFTWRQTPLWQTALTADWVRWVALREMPQAGETIILWARDDLFLDSPSRITRDQ
jgi:uncharacterized membrane protein